MPSSVRIVYPVLWSRLGRQACRAQSVATAAALSRLGHEVTILMPRGAADSRVGAAELCRWFEVKADFEVVQRRSRWSGERLHRSLMWLRQVFADPETRRADLIYSRIPAMIAMGGLAPRPFATDLYRAWPDSLPPIRPLVRRTARHPNCLGLVLHSKHAAAAYRRAGVADERLLVAYNGADAPAERIELSSARRQLGLPADRAVAAYSGRINRQKGLDQLLALARLRPSILFVLIGSEGEGSLEREARALANVQVVPWQTPAALTRWLGAADVLLIPPSLAPLERFGTCVMPIKLFTYLAAGRPILAPDAPDTAELLVQEENALLVPPDRPEAAAAALDRILADRALTERLADNARHLAGDLSWDARARRITAFLDERLRAREILALPAASPLGI